MKKLEEIKLNKLAKKVYETKGEDEIAKLNLEIETKKIERKLWKKLYKDMAAKN